MFGPNTLEPEWYWASGKPVLDSMFGPSTLDDSPEWYWAYGKPVTKAPKYSEALGHYGWSNYTRTIHLLNGIGHMANL